jgi:hypothetical protein
MYDVYYTTGGGPWVNAGTDTWVNIWLEEIAPKLKVKPVLLIHRNKPRNFNEYDYKFPIETHWHGDDLRKFEKIVKDCRRINILHGHYTPMKVLVDNKKKIYSNVLHNSVDHILKNSVGSDQDFGFHPYIDSSWEIDVNKWAKKSIWIGLYDIKYENQNIPNFYEFKHNRPLSYSNNLGFAARSEGRKNPHFLDGKKAYIFTDSSQFNGVFKQGFNMDTSKSKIYHYKPEFSENFYDMSWGISHSCFTYEPFGYSIFQAVDWGKLPILHTSWCKDLDYPYRATFKKDFDDIYNRLLTIPYEEKNKWFLYLKKYMIDNFTNKDKWVKELLDIYNI